MRIEFEIKYRDSDEKELQDDFARFIVKNMRRSIMAMIPPAKLPCYEYNIEHTTALGNRKSSRIDISDLLEFVLDNLVYVKAKEFYIIKFSNKREPKTKKSVDSIVRFIDKGNEEFPGIHIIGTVFNRYRDNMQKYWEFFVREELNRVSVSEVLVVR